MQKSVKWLLLVDDEGELLELLSTFFQMQFGDKVKIITAPDGIDATGKVRNQAYDCIVTDLKMPRKEGRAFVEAVHQSPLNEKTPVIIHTGFPDLELIKMFPMCTQIQKPATPEQVLEAVSTQLKLGRTDRRVGAHMLNMMIQASHTLLRKVSHDKVETLGARLKKKGEPFGSHFGRFVSCKMGSTTLEFAFAFPQPLLEELEKAVTNGKVSHKPDRVIQAATNTILSNSARLLNQGSMKVTKSSTFDQAKRSELPETKNRKGIVIPIDTKHGPLEILAVC